MKQPALQPILCLTGPLLKIRGGLEQLLDEGTIQPLGLGQVVKGGLRPCGRSGQGIAHRTLLSASLDRVKGRRSR